MDVAKHETSAIVQELRASQDRLGMARHRVPADMVPVQGVLLQHNLAGASARLSSERVTTGTTQRQYAEMREALARWEENDPRFAPARERAFYGALRNLLMECLSETTEQAQSDRLKAAYRWFSKNIPQQRPDNLRQAAAAATSLSVPRAVTTTYSNSPNKPSSPQAQQIQQVTAFEGKGEFYSVYSRDPDGHNSSTAAIRAYDAPYERPEATADRPDSQQAPRASAPSPPLPMIGDSLLSYRPSPSPSPLTVHNLSPSPEPAASAPQPQRGLQRRVPAKNRAQLTHAGTRYLSVAIQKEMHGLAEEDAEIADLRIRWHMTSEQEGSWWKDVQDSMSRWSVHRARVEEEISRRQEASRYGAPHTNKYSTTFNVLVKDKEKEVQQPAEASAMHGKVSLAAKMDADKSSMPIYTVSPYTRMKLVAAHPPVPTRIEDFAKQEMQDLFKARDRLEEKGRATSLVTLRRGLMPAPERTIEECMKALPKPGAYIEPSRNPPPVKSAKKKSRSKSSGKKKK